MSIDGLLYLQRASHVHRVPHMPTEGLLCSQRASFTCRGPLLSTEDLIYIQRASFTYTGASYTQRGLGMLMEGPPLPKEGLLQSQVGWGGG